MADRLESIERLIESRPDDPRLRFGLALEYLGRGHDEEAVHALRAYLRLTEDEGNAWGRLGAALRRLGRDEEAREAYRRGVDAANRHGHPSMAEEFVDILEEWE